MLLKILGLILGVIGFAILKYFPGDAYQHGGMVLSGLLTGGVLLIGGILLLIFG